LRQRLGFNHGLKQSGQPRSLIPEQQHTGWPVAHNSRVRLPNYPGKAALAPVDPISSDSAVAVISKRGNTSLRYSLYQASVMATIHDGHFRELFTRYLSGREKDRGIKTKMLVIAWTMIKNKTAFDPTLLEVNEVQ
jgi:hypothetical protein